MAIWSEEGDKTIKMDRWSLCQGIHKKVDMACLRHLIWLLDCLIICLTWCSFSSSLLQVLNHSFYIELGEKGRVLEIYDILNKEPLWPHPWPIDMTFQFSIFLLYLMSKSCRNLWNLEPGATVASPIALFDTALFKKMNILFEWIFWILKKWIFCLNEYSGF